MLGGGKADLRVGHVVDAVEALQTDISIDTTKGAGKTDLEERESVCDEPRQSRTSGNGRNTLMKQRPSPTETPPMSAKMRQIFPAGAPMVSFMLRGQICAFLVSSYLTWGGVSSGVRFKRISYTADVKEHALHGLVLRVSHGEQLGRPETHRDGKVRPEESRTTNGSMTAPVAFW